MVKALFKNRAEEEKFKRDFMLGCDDMLTLKELCKNKSTRSLLKQLVDNSKILLDESKKMSSQASALKEKMKKEYDSSTLNKVYKIFGL